MLDFVTRLLYFLKILDTLHIDKDARKFPSKLVNTSILVITRNRTQQTISYKEEK